MSIDQNIISVVLAIMGDQGKKEFEREVWKNRDTDIKYQGKEITLPGDPSPMPLEAAIDALKRKLNDENQIMDVHETISGYPFDAAVSFVKAMKEIYGWSSAIPTPGFWGDTPPRLITVKTGPEAEDTIQVPLGSFYVPGIENIIQTVITPDGQFHVISKCLKREKSVLMDLVALTKRIIQRESIYRGKALSINVNDNGELDRGIEPTFISTKHVLPEELIMSKSIEELIEDSVFTPIKHTQECVRHGIPLRRTVLLEGPYGTGKTMTASVASKICIDNGWTFIALDKVQGLKEALLFARQYQPALVFAEDVDRIAEIRNDEANDLLNTIDGVLNKDANVITILTTNFVERIDKAMMRPGRLDAVINIAPPDAEAAIRLVHLYARGLIKADEPLTQLGKELNGHIPATIREVVERAKLGMVRHNRNLLTEDDLLISSNGMKRHLELLNRPVGPRQTVGEKLADNLREVITGVDSDSLREVSEIVSNVQETVKESNGYEKAILDKVSKSNGGVLPRDFAVVARHVKEIHKTIIDS